MTVLRATPYPTTLPQRRMNHEVTHRAPVEEDMRRKFWPALKRGAAARCKCFQRKRLQVREIVQWVPGLPKAWLVHLVWVQSQNPRNLMWFPPPPSQSKSTVRCVPPQNIGD